MKVKVISVLEDNYMYLVIEESTRDAVAVDAAVPKRVSGPPGWVAGPSRGRWPHTGGVRAHVEHPTGRTDPSIPMECGLRTPVPLPWAVRGSRVSSAVPSPCRSRSPAEPTASGNNPKQPFGAGLHAQPRFPGSGKAAAEVAVSPVSLCLMSPCATPSACKRCRGF